jgi:hypothetical protein
MEWAAKSFVTPQNTRVGLVNLLYFLVAGSSRNSRPVTVQGMTELIQIAVPCFSLCVNKGIRYIELADEAEDS